MRTPLGQPCQWRDYKAVNLHKLGVEAFFLENHTLVEWVNQQPSSDPLICLGDGHQGIWNIFATIGDSQQRREILDWYHLVENLGKVGGSIKRLNQVEALLWKGKVGRAIEEFDDWKHEKVSNFVAYLRKHRHRIVNYDYYQSEGSRLALEQLNRLLNRLAGELKSQVLNGKLKMFPKFFIIDALILMVVFQLNLTKFFYLLHNWDALCSIPLIKPLA